MVASGTGSIEQINHYYPYGGLIGDISTNPETQKYKYNGKEYDTMNGRQTEHNEVLFQLLRCEGRTDVKHLNGLNTYDYGARQYDPARITWDRMDPLCEKYYNINTKTSVLSY